MTFTPSAVRIAVDLLGGDGSPDTVVAGALIAAEEEPGVDLVLVGPPALAEPALRSRGAAGRLRVVAATDVVAMTDDPAHAVRAKRDASIRVAARLVRDGEADATVSIGSTGAAMAAAVFTLGRLPGVTRPALAVTVPARAHPVVLLDVGANSEATPGLLAQFALCGAAYARSRLQLEAPRVGLLCVGAEAGKGDGLRREAHATVAAMLRDLPVEFVGNVEGGDVVLGGRADVVVTDGFTGNVLLKAVEATFTVVGDVVAATLAGAAPHLAGRVAAALAPLHPERLGGAVLLGVPGVSVVGHGSASARSVASCIRLAASAVRDDLVGGVGAALADLVDRRRALAGLAPRATGIPAS